MTELLQSIEDHVRNKFSENDWEGFHYHNLDHTINTVDEVRKLGEKSNLDKETIDTLLIAAWFHDLGYSENLSNHEDKSIELASNFLTSKDVSRKIIEEVAALIDSTKIGIKVFDTLSKKILHDADLSSAGLKGFSKRSGRLRKEWSTMCNKEYSDGDWNHLQEEYLEKLTYLSPAGIKRYDSTRQKNHTKFQKRRKSEQMASKKLGRGVETMYRVTYRNHINFSAIADNKANMMIGINAIILSIVLTVFGSGLVGSIDGLLSNIVFVIPVAVLMLCSSVAMVCAVLSARPNISKNQITYDPENLGATNGILFFGNYTSLSQGEFNEYMTKLLDNEELTYENMNNDLYNLGSVLQKKYVLLRKAYNIFMFGLIISISLFFILLILS